MQIELTPEDRDLLLHLVDVAFRDITPEIRHTDSRAYRDDLREQRRELQHLHALLGGVGPRAVDAPAPGLVGSP